MILRQLHESFPKALIQRSPLKFYRVKVRINPTFVSFGSKFGIDSTIEV